MVLFVHPRQVNNLIQFQLMQLRRPTRNRAGRSEVSESLANPTKFWDYGDTSHRDIRCTTSHRHSNPLSPRTDEICLSNTMLPVALTTMQRIVKQSDISSLDAAKIRTQFARIRYLFSCIYKHFTLQCIFSLLKDKPPMF